MKKKPRIIHAWLRVGGIICRRFTEPPWPEWVNVESNGWHRVTCKDCLGSKIRKHIDSVSKPKHPLYLKANLKPQAWRVIVIEEEEICQKSEMAG